MARSTEVGRKAHLKMQLSRSIAFGLLLIRRFGPKHNQEALVGDLLERLAEGRTANWFWREILGALTAALFMRLKGGCSEMAFALAGTGVFVVFERTIVRISLDNPLFGLGVGLPWPLSSIYDFSFRAAWVMLVLVPEFTVVLAFKKALTRTNVSRAILISLPLIMLGELVAFLWLTNLPYSFRWLYAVPNAGAFFSAFLISLWASQATHPSSHNSRAATI